MAIEVFFSGACVCVCGGGYPMCLSVLSAI